MPGDARLCSLELECAVWIIDAKHVKLPSNCRRYGINLGIRWSHVLMVATEQRYAESIVVETFGLSAHHLSGRHDLVGNAFIAAAEGFFGRLKQEFFHKRSFQGVSIDEFITLLDEYMVWYRDKRIKLEYGMSIMDKRIQLGLVA